MMKKFVLILALVSLVATAAFAGDVKFSGNVKLGYDFKFTSDSFTPAQHDFSDDVHFDVSISDPDGLWSLGVNSPYGVKDFEGSIGVSFSKALAAVGVDMGDWTVDFTIGKKQKNLNAYRAGIETAGKLPSSVTVGYGSIAQVKIVATPVAPKTLAVSALITPIDGLKFGVGYGRNSKMIGEGSDDKPPYTNILATDAKADIAKLIGTEDFKASVSFAGTFGLKDDSTVSPKAARNDFFAEVSGGVGKVEGKVILEIFNTKTNLTAKVDLKDLVEGLKLGANVTFTGLDNSHTLGWKIGAAASYKFGGVAYSLDASYKSDDQTFTVTPAVSIGF